MKLFVVLVLVFIIYSWIKGALQNKWKDQAGKVNYQSPDEFHTSKTHLKDVTAKSRIVDEKEK